MNPDDEFDRARFDESLELARTQLAFPLPDPEIDDEMEIGR